MKIRPQILKVLLHLIQTLAFSVFVGIAAYGILIYYGGETRQRIPGGTSILLGLAAVVCVVIIVIVGGVMDKQASMNKEQD